MKNRIIALLMIFTLLCSCNGQGSNTSSTTSGSSGIIYDSASLSAASAWREVTLLNSNENLKTSARLTDIKTDTKSGDNVYVATSDNGVFVSRDGAVSFNNSSAGLLTENIQLLAVDPNNNDYILAFAVDGALQEEVKGIYASSNAGRGWKKISTSFNKIQGAKMQLLFDDASYDSSKKNSSIVYLTGVVMKGDSVSAGQNTIYRSTDGGRTFSLASYIRLDSEIAVHPTRGYVYITDSTGFYRSIDHASNFEMMTGESCTHVFTTPNSPEDVVLAGINGMIISHNSGVSFESTAGIVPNMSQAQVFASALSNANFMSVFQNYDGSYDIKFSRDGGVSWQTSQIENKNKAVPDDYIIDFYFNVQNTATVLMIYKNEVYKSTDSGATFKLVGAVRKKAQSKSEVFENKSLGYLAFVVNNDTVVYSANEGESLKPITVTNLKDGEYIASAYLTDKKTLMLALGYDQSEDYTLAFLSTSNNSVTRTAFNKLKTPRLFGDNNNQNILFAGNYYSIDMGVHWEEMKNCDAVLYQNLVSPGELFGVKDTKLVMSVDKGKNWIEIFDAQTKIEDVAYDYYEKCVYVVTGDKFLKSTLDGTVQNLTNKIPNNTLGEKILTEIEVDYIYPNVIYVGGKSDNYINDCSVMISVDAGETWRVISATFNNSNAISCMPIQPIELTVNPVKRVLTAYCGSFGTFEFDITKTQWGKK